MFLLLDLQPLAQKQLKPLDNCLSKLQSKEMRDNVYVTFIYLFALYSWMCVCLYAQFGTAWRRTESLQQLKSKVFLQAYIANKYTGFW